MPPIHCIIARQNSTPRGKASTSMITVAPVVVNPDIDSKKPSVMLVTVPENKNGNIPKIEKKIHTVAVSNNPSRLRIVLLLGRMKWFITKPAPKVIATDIANSMAIFVSP